MSSRKLELTEEAELDIQGILRFTRATWGERKRHDYARQITNAMNEVTRFPGLGQRRDQIASGLRARRVGQHVIYYRVTEQLVSVVRVLHERMDASEQVESCGPVHTAAFTSRIENGASGPAAHQDFQLILAIEHKAA